jgi:hypothetical protein
MRSHRMRFGHGADRLIQPTLIAQSIDQGAPVLQKIIARDLLRLDCSKIHDVTKEQRHHTAHAIFQNRPAVLCEIFAAGSADDLIGGKVIDIRQAAYLLCRDAQHRLGIRRRHQHMLPGRCPAVPVTRKGSPSCVD